MADGTKLIVLHEDERGNLLHAATVTAQQLSWSDKEMVVTLPIGEVRNGERIVLQTPALRDDDTGVFVLDRRDDGSAALHVESFVDGASPTEIVLDGRRYVEVEETEDRVH